MHAPRLELRLSDVDVTLGHRTPVRVRGWIFEDGVEAHAEQANRATSVLRLRAKPPWGAEYPVWSMAAGAPTFGSRSDVIRVWMDDVFKGLDASAKARGEHGWWEDLDQVEIHDTLSALRTITAHLAREAVARCDPTARRAAMRFSQVTRAWVYQRVVDDGSGRVAQLAASAPGALVFAAGSDAAREFAGTVTGVLADAVAGVTVPRLVARAVENWAIDAAHRVLIDRGPNGPGLPTVWHSLADLDAGATLSLLDRQRRLIRRTGPWASPGLAHLPPPLVVAESDIPSAVRANARWMRVLKASPRLILECAPEELDAGLAIATFLSRNAVAAFPRSRHTDSIRRRIEELFDYVRATGRRPARNTDPVRLFAAARRWHREFEDDRAPGPDPFPESRSADLPPPETPLPRARVRPWENADGDQLAAIATVGALEQESAEMHHCVSSYLDLVMSGACDIVSGVVAGLRVTIEVRYHANGQPYVAQARGRKNVRLTAKQRAIVSQWIDDAWAMAWVNG